MVRLIIRKTVEEMVHVCRRDNLNYRQYIACMMQELLPLHAGQLPGEEAGGASGGGPSHGDHHLRGPPRPLPIPRRRRRRRPRKRRDELHLVAS